VLFGGACRDLRTFNLSRRSAPRRFHLREAEVQDLRLPSVGHEDVRGLDVAVDNPLCVGRIERVGELDPQVQKLLRLDGPAGDPTLQRPALQKLHGDEGLAFVLVDVVDGADVGVVQSGSGAGLTLEPLLRLVAREQPLR